MKEEGNRRQLDVFEERKKEEIEAENAAYNEKKGKIQADLTSTEEILEDSNIPWSDRKEYEGDVQYYKRLLRDLEREHRQNLDNIRKAYLLER